MIARFTRLVAMGVSMVFLSPIGCNPTPSSLPPTPAQVASEEARSANEALTNLAAISWMDFVDLAGTNDQRSIAAARAQFMDADEHGFRYLLDRLPQPKVDSAEQLLGLQLLEEMAPAIQDPELRTSVVEVLLDLRDRASSKEIRNRFTQHLTVMLDLAIESSPSNPDLRYFRGDERLTRGEHDLAMEDLSMAIELRPNFANAFYLRGLTQRARGNNREAIADYSEALDFEPDYPDVLVARAASYVSLSEPDKAILDLTAAIQSKPDWAHAYTLRAQAYQAIKEEEKASADLTTADHLRAGKQQDSPPLEANQ